MALASDGAVRSARRIAMAWAVIVYPGMILVGLCARAALSVEADYDREKAFFDLGQELFDPILFGIILAAVLCIDMVLKE